VDGFLLPPVLLFDHPDPDGQPLFFVHPRQVLCHNSLGVIEPVPVNELRREFAARIGQRQPVEDRLAMRNINPMCPAITCVADVELPLPMEIASSIFPTLCGEKHSCRNDCFSATPTYHTTFLTEIT